MLLIAVSPEIGKKLLQLRKSLHIAILNGIVDGWNLNSSNFWEEVNPVVLSNAAFNEFGRLWDYFFISSSSLSFGGDYGYDGMFTGARNKNQSKYSKVIIRFKA